MTTSRTTAATPKRAKKRGHVARLLVVYTPATGGEGVTRAVGSGGLTIHRQGADEGLELDDPEVSRAHARVQRVPGGEGYRIEDLDSRNGTFVNARRIRESELASGDVIRVGSHLLLFELLDLEAVQHLPLKRQVGESLVGESHALSRVREEIQRLAPLAIPVENSTTAETDNFVGVERPLSLTLDELGLHGTSVFETTTQTDDIKDQLLVYDNAATGKNKTPSATYFYFNGAWRKVGADVATNFGSDEIAATAAIAIRKAPAGVQATSFWVNDWDLPQ